MGKFIKYEIKGTYKFMMGMLAITLIGYTVLQSGSNMLNSPESYSAVRFWTMVSVLSIFAAYVISFFQIVGSFKNELDEGIGYLTFTLPLTGNKIVGAKLIVALMWIFTMAVVTGLYNMLLVNLLYGGESMWNIFKMIFGLSNRISILFIISGIITAVMTLILIYLSMALSKVTIKNRKIGALWFIIFLFINSAAGFLVVRFGELIPYYLDIFNFEIFKMSGTQMAMTAIISQNMNGATLNLGSILGQILVSIGAFLGTGYLLEKRIDL